MIVGNYVEIEGVKVFPKYINEKSNDYNSQGLDILFDEEMSYFWFLSRKEFIFQQMKRYVDFSSNIIEVGAGTGNVSMFLKQKGYLNISVGEMHLNGLKYAKSYGLDRCYQFDLLCSPFKNEFDVVCMFDVLEHIYDDNKALLNSYQMLKPNGQIILTVPAHKWLWHRGDAIGGHKRRYNKKELSSILNKNGFSIVNARYFFISIVPLLLLRKLLNYRENEEKSNFHINPIINKILLFISRIENKCNRFLPNMFGGSLLLIAKKNDTV